MPHLSIPIKTPIGLKTYFLLVSLLLFLNQANSQDFWEQLSFPDSVHIQSITTNSQGHIFVGTGTYNVIDGVFRSTNEGESWDLVMISLYNSIFSIEININDDIFIGQNGGEYLQVSRDNGDTWQPIFIEEGYTGNILKIKSIGEDTIYFASYHGPRLYRSFDGGVSWNSSLTSDTTSDYITDIAVTSNQDIYVSCNAYFYNNGGVYKSTNGGEAWEFMGLLNHQVMCIETNSNDDVFTGDWWVMDYDETMGIYAQYNNQNNFENILGISLVTDIAINSENHIYLTANETVFYSLDNGESFENITDELSNYKSILHFDNQDYLYAAHNTSLVRSINSTITSIDENQPLTQSVFIYPNPCNGYLFIEIYNNLMIENKYSVHIYDLTGKIVSSNKVLPINNQFAIDISHLNNGMYVIEIVSMGEKLRSSIFINH